LIPHNKAMAAKYKNQPFAVLGINSDGGRSAATKILAKHGIKYRNAIDGSTEGPIATLYKVTGWPTVYVLDKKGVIRYKYIGVDPDVLSKSVETLLKRK
jgi:hypothetical protein